MLVAQGTKTKPIVRMMEIDTDCHPDVKIKTKPTARYSIPATGRNPSQNWTDQSKPEITKTQVTKNRHSHCQKLTFQESEDLETTKDETMDNDSMHSSNSEDSSDYSENSSVEEDNVYKTHPEEHMKVPAAEATLTTLDIDNLYKSARAIPGYTQENVGPVVDFALSAWISGNLPHLKLAAVQAYKMNNYKKIPFVRQSYCGEQEVRFSHTKLDNIMSTYGLEHYRSEPERNSIWLNPHTPKKMSDLILKLLDEMKRNETLYHQFHKHLWTQMSGGMKLNESFSHEFTLRNVTFYYNLMMEFAGPCKPTIMEDIVLEFSRRSTGVIQDNVALEDKLTNAIAHVYARSGLDPSTVECYEVEDRFLNEIATYVE